MTGGCHCRGFRFKIVVVVIVIVDVVVDVVDVIVVPCVAGKDNGLTKKIKSSWMLSRHHWKKSSKSKSRCPYERSISPGAINSSTKTSTDAYHIVSSATIFQEWQQMKDEVSAVAAAASSFSLLRELWDSDLFCDHHHHHHQWLTSKFTHSQKITIYQYDLQV
jgi:hypothetical protein